tara:strand:- start:16624 stop:17772 length:1149 start_codon:yes stop_codon:yes gene_type:complete
MKNIGLIGCGNIAETYFRSQEYFNNIKFISCADINDDSSKLCAEKYNIKAQSVEDLLNDKNVDIILNLTIPSAHYEVIKKTLIAGKHTYCEKPLSISFDEGKELLDIAEKKNLYLGNAPDTFLGGGGQLSRELIDSGSLGEIRLGNFIFASPGLESWHPNPEPWFFNNVGGPVIDMCPYFFTMLVHLLGPAKSVSSIATTVHQHRIIGSGPKKGKKFKVETPTSYLINIEFCNGVLVEGLVSFDVINHNRNHMELYGTKGSIIVPDPNMFGGPVQTSSTEAGEWTKHSTEKMQLGKNNIQNHSGRSNESSEQSNYRGVGLSEMIYAMENNTNHRCNGKLALHVLDLIESTMISARNNNRVTLRSICDKPIAFTEKDICKIIK